jgi:hypothetical protein
MAPSPNQILGRVTVTLDGTVLPIKQGTTEVTPGYGERTPVEGESQTEGFTEKSTTWMIKYTLLAKGGMTAAKVWSWVDRHVQVQGDNGLLYDLIQTTTTKVDAIKSGEGAWAVEMFCMRGNEATS